MNCRKLSKVNMNEISPLYAEVENKNRNGYDSKFVKKLIGWYNPMEGEYWLIMDTKNYFVFECFKEYLMRKGFHIFINPKTFISECLGKNNIVTGRMTKSNGYTYPRYDHTKPIDGEKIRYMFFMMGK